MVLGNHDLMRAGAMRVTEFDETKALLTSPGNPTLVFTHVPLLNVLDGCVNVHGHTHEKLLAPDSPRINVSVEQLEYRLIGMSRLRRLARVILAGDGAGGETTMDRGRTLECP